MNSPDNGSAQRISRRSFFRRLAVPAMLAGLASIDTAGAYAAVLAPQQVQVSRIRLQVPRLPSSFHGLKIAFISDIHIGTSPGGNYLRRVFELATRERPALILLGGDYVTGKSAGEREGIRGLVSRLQAPLGVFAVLGNHDHWSSAEAVGAVLRESGATVLRNSSVPIQIGSQTIHIAGVDDVLERKHDLGKALASVPPGACALLLAHEPDFADQAARDPRVALQLSGHSHGGQVKLPRVPRVLPYLARKYPEGFYGIGSLQLYTSRGVGTVRPAIRINCPPELPILELTATR